MLFGKKKEEDEKQQTLDVKEAASEKKDEKMPEETQKAPEMPKNDFVNPFSQSQNNEDFMQNHANFSQTQQNNQQQQNAPAPNFDVSQQQNSASIDEEKINDLIEETVEKILDEKWEKFIQSVEKIINWKEKQEEEMNKVKTDIIDMRDAVEKVEKKIFAKINEYDKDILDVGSEIRALEKVFQKITPTLVNNISELTRITDDLREIRGPKKENDKKE
ncbi:MAG: hypothetical protein ACOCXG_04080 [Nanoarchaeota archaeon]